MITNCAMITKVRLSVNYGISQGDLATETMCELSLVITNCHNFGPAALSLEFEYKLSEIFSLEWYGTTV